MARPKKVIDPEVVRKLAMIGCKGPEIAAVCNCSTDTLERRFAAQIQKGREQGKSSLRRMQWQAAEKGNAVMMIWLGKQLLDQRDYQRLEHEGEITHLHQMTNEELDRRIAEISSQLGVAQDATLAALAGEETSH